MKFSMSNYVCLVFLKVPFWEMAFPCLDPELGVFLDPEERLAGAAVAGVVCPTISLKGRRAKLFLLFGEDRSDLSLETGSERAISTSRRDLRVDGDCDIIVCTYRLDLETPQIQKAAKVSKVTF